MTGTPDTGEQHRIALNTLTGKAMAGAIWTIPGLVLLYVSTTNPLIAFFFWVVWAAMGLVYFGIVEVNRIE